MGGELRVELVPEAEHARGARQVGHIGIRLAREHRIVFVTLELGQLDLGIPVSALDQPYRDPVAGVAGQFGQPVDRRPAAPEIDLQRQAEAVPAFELLVAQHFREDVELQHQARSLLGVDGQRDASVAGAHGKIAQHRDQFRHHAFALGGLVARVQRRELHRNAGRVEDVAAVGGLADRVDGSGVGIAIASRVGRRQRRLAQHVERIAIALVGLVARALHGRLDVAAHDVLVTHDAHGLPDRQPHHRFAGLVGQPGQHGAHVTLCGLPDLDHPAGQHQAPGRGIDEQRLALAQVRLPVGFGQLVRNELFGRFVVRNPQQCLGQAHEHHALFRRKVVFAHESLHRAVVLAALAHALDQFDGQRFDLLPVGAIQPDVFQQMRDVIRLRDGPGKLERLARRVCREFGAGYKWHVVAHFGLAPAGILDAPGAWRRFWIAMQPVLPRV